MPRPKRTKIANSAPASRVVSSGLAPKSKPTRGAIEDDFNDEDLGTSMVKPKPSDRVSSARSLARKSITQSNTGESAAALEGLQKRRDAAMARLEAATASTETISSGEHAALSGSTSSSPVVEYGRKQTAAVENSLLEFGKFRRARKPSILGRPASRARSNSVESNLAEDTGIRTLLQDSSLLPRGDIRQQRRQSTLNKPSSSARSSSVDLGMSRTPGPTDSVLRPKQFNRRPRQNSILGTARKDQREKRKVDSDKSADEDEVEDDFNPDDESTPLNLSKTCSMVGQSSHSASAVNHRKRKLSNVPVRSSSPLPPSDEETTSSTNLGATPPERSVRISTPGPRSETMAPPQSSSPARPSPDSLRQSRRVNARPSAPSIRRAPARKVHLPPGDSPPSSPPSLTHSPNAPQAAPKREARSKPQSAALSTFQLQALLPRRRHRTTRDPYDVEGSDGEVDVSGLTSDEDELTNLSVHPNRRSRRPAVIPARRVARLKPGPKANSRTKAAPQKGFQRAASGVKMTYLSRQTSSDKENDAAGSGGDEEAEEGADDSLGPVADSELENSQELEARVGTELKRAKRKFENVDKWEMEFEDVTASSSSPWDAR